MHNGRGSAVHHYAIASCCTASGAQYVSRRSAARAISAFTRVFDALWRSGALQNRDRATSCRSLLKTPEFVAWPAQAYI